MINLHDNFAKGWSYGPGVCGAGSEDQYINADANAIITMLSHIEPLFEGKLLVNEAGCGDLYWLRNHHAFFETYVDYHGYELQKREIHENCLNLAWTRLDICKQAMRSCDVILSRLVFIHLPNEMILQALNLFRLTGAKYLIVSHYNTSNNENRHTSPSYVGLGYDLSKAPFNLKLIRVVGKTATFEL